MQHQPLIERIVEMERRHVSHPAQLFVLQCQDSSAFGEEFDFDRWQGVCAREISLCAPPVAEENKSALTIGEVILHSPLLHTHAGEAAEYFLYCFDQIIVWGGCLLFIF